MRRETALRKALEYFNIFPDEEGELELLLYPVDTATNGDYMSLLSFGNRLDLSDMDDDRIEDFQERMYDALFKRYQRDLKIFKELFSLNDKWAGIALWNAIPPLKYTFQYYKRNDFSEEEWRYLELRLKEEEKYEKSYGRIEPGSLNNSEYLIEETDIVQFIKPPYDDCEHNMMTLGYKHRGKNHELSIIGSFYTGVFSCYPRSFFFNISRNCQAVCALHVRYSEKTKEMEVIIIPSVDITADILGQGIGIFFKFLQNNKLSLYEENRNMAYKLNKRTIRPELIRCFAPCSNTILQTSLESVGFCEKGRMRKLMYVPDSTGKTDCIYYEKVMMSPKKEKTTEKLIAENNNLAPEDVIMPILYNDLDDRFYDDSDLELYDDFEY